MSADATYQKLLETLADEAHERCLAVIAALAATDVNDPELMDNWRRQWRRAELETEALHRGAFALRPRQVLELDHVTLRLLVTSVEFMRDYARSSLDMATLSSDRQGLQDQVDALDNLLADLRSR